MSGALDNPTDKRIPGAQRLLGERIVITRARSQADKLAKLFEAEGAQVIEFETIEIEYSGDAFTADGAYDWVIVTSANGVIGLARNLAASKRKVTDLRPARFFAIGPATAEQLRREGVQADTIPDDFVGEGGVAALKAAVPSWLGLRVLVARGNLARPLLAESLRAWGAAVDERTVYTTSAPKIPENRIAALIAAEPHWVTFTSGSTAVNFAAILGVKRLEELGDTAAFASIGPQTSESCRGARIPVAVEAQRHDSEGLVEAIVGYVSKEGH